MKLALRAVALASLIPFAAGCASLSQPDYREESAPPPTVESGPYTVDKVPMFTRYDVTHAHKHPECTPWRHRG